MFDGCRCAWVMLEMVMVMLVGQALRAMSLNERYAAYDRQEQARIADINLDDRCAACGQQKINCSDYGTLQHGLKSRS